ncbi:MAG: gamma-glutamyltransferase [Acidimicrobiales bacterium]|nr:gamma-glutamyltransferase [Acidimicrobiales bacterium]
MAAGHQAAADAAADALLAGGNAFDGAVAAGFASAVCEPGFTSLAGGGFLLARTAAGADVVFDFFVDTPGRGLPPAERRPAFEEVTVSWGAATQAFHCGLGSVAVPGTLAGLLHVHRRLGRLPLADVVTPAVRLARHGVEVSPAQAADYRLLAPILQRTPAARAIFSPHGTLLEAGDTLANPDLADFIERLGSGRDASRDAGAAAAAALVDQMAAGAGLVTAADLAAYEVVERAPLASTYRGRTVLSNPPPSFGGSLMALALRWLEDTGPLAPADSPELALALARLMIDVDAHRSAEPVDPTLPVRPAATRGTTHVTVADAEGNVAAMTASNGECSGDVVPGTGVLLNNMLGEDDLHPDGFHAAPPGTRVASMMSPTFVLDAAGGVDLAIGSGGSKRIRSAILQVLVGVLDQGRTLADAVDAPRIHWDRDHLEVEPGLPEVVVAALRDFAPVNVWPDRNMYFGGTHAVQPGRAAAGDPRRGGAVRVV